MYALKSLFAPQNGAVAASSVVSASRNAASMCAFTCGITRSEPASGSYSSGNPSTSVPPFSASISSRMTEGMVSSGGGSPVDDELSSPDEDEPEDEPDDSGEPLVLLSSLVVVVTVVVGPLDVSAVVVSVVDALVLSVTLVGDPLELSS